MVSADYLRVPETRGLAEGPMKKALSIPSKHTAAYSQTGLLVLLGGGFHTTGTTIFGGRTHLATVARFSRAQMGVLKQIFTSRKWWKHVPINAFAMGQW